MAVPQRLAIPIGVALPEGGVLALPETEDGEPTPQAAEVLQDAVAKADAVLVGPGLMDETACSVVVRRLLTQVQCRYVLTPEHCRRRPAWSI
jgi:ADP-dependent NAD(P)H-hydrate dehydratase